MGWFESRYRFERRLADHVDAVFDPASGRRAVRKRAEGPVERDALAREVAFLAKSRHPALRRVIDVEAGWPPRRAIFEWVDGSAIHRASCSRHVMEQAFVDVLCVLEHLHQAGLVHGDLKPDHVLLDASHSAHLIDLGLILPIGTVARGGTPRYMAPEVKSGEPSTVGSDLYALGMTFAESKPLSPRLASLVEACTHPMPSRRPASALACLSSLGQVRRRLDILGSFPLLLRDDVMSLARAALDSDCGDTLLIRGPVGCGRRRLAREVHSLALLAGKATLVATLPEQIEELTSLARAMDPLPDLDPMRFLAVLGSRAAREGVVFVVQAQKSLNATWLVALSVAFARAKRGSLIVVGEVPDSFSALDVGRKITVAPATPEQASELFSIAGSRLDHKKIQRVVEVAGGRMGVVARLARQSHVELFGKPQQLDLAISALDRGETREVASDFGEGPPHPDVLRRRAQNLFQLGELTDAIAQIERLGEEASPADQLLEAQCHERLGEYRKAEEILRRVSSEVDPQVSFPAVALLAHVILTLGNPEEAEDIAALGLLALQNSAATIDSQARSLRDHCIGKLHTVRSDAALQCGQPDRALAFAEHAVSHARSTADSNLIAQACARVGRALSLAGRPLEAKRSFAEALASAEEGGDMVALPAFVMNLATAEHAAGDFASAIEHYQEAAQLALRFGRRANWLAAAINLAGLWVFVGADVEAKRLLEEARSVALETGSAVYEGQERLVLAEAVRETDPVRARDLVRDAELVFERARAVRQALEARLLDAELGIARDTAETTLRFVEMNRAELTSSGLEARGQLLAARAHRELGNNERSKYAAQKSADAAEAAGDRELRARALYLCALASDALVPGSGIRDLRAAQEELDLVAHALPVSMRQRFFLAKERRLIVNARVPGVELGPVRGISPDARRLLHLVRRIACEEQESKILEAALDEAVALTGAERAFLLLARTRGPAEVAVARNLDKETLRKSRTRFSRSVAERVLASGERVVTASAADDPDLNSSRSILDLGLRSILCVPVPGPSGVLGALYLDHRFESGRFANGEPELAAALADVVGIALQNARLLQEASNRRTLAERQAEDARQEVNQRAREVARLSDALARGAATSSIAREGGIVGTSPALQRALDVARRVAQSDLPVLVAGESGTGKELFARYIHERSLRSTKPFVAINCGAVPEALLESELFGHRRGAFTGATRDHPGLFREADRGTLFLDEIGEMPLKMQTRLLRVLQEGEVRPVGSTSQIDVDVRIILATHRDLAEGVQKGTFREDLYYRLVGARVVLPPLRERREDLPDLCAAILQKVAARTEKKSTLSRAAIEAILRHDWPGNIRELENTLMRGALLAQGSLIDLADLDLGDAIRGRQTALRGFDRELLAQALRAAKGNRSEAARVLGISRVTMHRWMKRYDVS